MPHVVEPANAPIAIFAYNRPEHTRQMLESLATNPEFSESPIWAFCDGPKLPDDETLLERTRQVVREHTPDHAVILEREGNWGLAASLTAGISELCDEFGRIIVCEDDLIFSPLALGYLNHALNLYRDEERVMHVAAYMFPVEGRLPPAFFYREATCWGWGTWARAWRHFEPSSQKILDYVESNSLQRSFNVNDTMYFLEILRQQAKGLIDSWAIRWYGSMVMRGGLALHPGGSFVQNRGFDGTGVHCSKTTRFDVSLAAAPVTEFPSVVEECQTAVQAMMRYRNKPKTTAEVAAAVEKRFRRTIRKAMASIKI